MPNQYTIRRICKESGLPIPEHIADSIKKAGKRTRVRSDKGKKHFKRDAAVDAFFKYAEMLAANKAHVEWLEEEEILKHGTREEKIAALDRRRIRETREAERNAIREQYNPKRKRVQEYGTPEAIARDIAIEEERYRKRERNKELRKKRNLQKRAKLKAAGIDPRAVEKLKNKIERAMKRNALIPANRICPGCGIEYKKDSNWVTNINPVVCRKCNLKSKSCNSIKEG